MSIKFQGRRKGTNQYVTVGEPFTFPAGEAHIKGLENVNTDDFDYFIADLRGHSPQDLFHLASWVTALDSISGASAVEQFPIKYVLLPYIPAARADRGVPFGAKVYAEFFNGLWLDRIICVDPHSPVAPKLYYNSEGIHGSNMVEFPFERIIKDKIAHPSGDQFQMDHDYVGVIAPDTGARDRAKRAANVLHVPVYTAGKTRDFETGKLTGFHMEDELPAEGKFLIVDDICDGGGTFIGLAKAIDVGPDRLDLWVSHGVFSQGLTELTKYFGKIHTTDSYFSLDNPAFKGTGIRIGEALPGHGADLQVEVHSITAHLYGEASRLHGEAK